MPTGVFHISTTKQRELIDITNDVAVIVSKENMNSGVLYLFNPHTTAGLTINEGADPAVRTDIIQGLNHLVPENLTYRHMEGNSPAHIMAMLAGSALNVILNNKKILLGTWQKIFFCEFDGPRTRSVYWKYLPDND